VESIVDVLVEFVDGFDGPIDEFVDIIAVLFDDGIAEEFAEEFAEGFVERFQEESTKEFTEFGTSLTLEPFEDFS